MKETKKLYQDMKNLQENLEKFCDTQEDCIDCPFKNFGDRCPTYLLVDCLKEFKEWREENDLY